MKKVIYKNTINSETISIVMTDTEAADVKKCICNKCPFADKYCSLCCSASPMWDGQPLGVDPEISVVDC